MAGEIIHEFPAPGRPAQAVAHVRSTFITTGIETLRSLGLFERWSAGLDAKTRDELVTSIAGTWMPLDLAMRYYRGCDALGLSHDEVVAIGKRVGDRAGQSVLSAVKHIAAGVGATPWSMAAHFDRLWIRAFDGGQYRFVKMGPKDANFEAERVPMAASPYFRAAFSGVILAGMSLVTKTCTSRIVSVGRGQDSFVLRLAWV